MIKITSKIVSFVTVLSIVFVSSSFAQASTFSIGSRGQEVADLQIKLIEAGYNIPAITSGGVSAGYYGIQTQRAEEAYNANVDGGKVGAVASLNQVDNPFVQIGGQDNYYYRQPFVATSSVICSFLNPFNATSTLARYGVIFKTNGIGGTQTVDLATSTTNQSTSSPAFVRAFSVPASQGQLSWYPNGTTTNPALILSTTDSTGSNNVIIRPTDYINLKIASGTPSVYGSYLTGQCTAVLQKL